MTRMKPKNICVMNPAMAADGAGQAGTALGDGERFDEILDGNLGHGPSCWMQKGNIRESGE